MPTFDTWLWILAALIPLGMAALGGYVSTNRPVIRSIFWVAGLVGMGVVIVSAMRNQNALRWSR